MSASDEGEAARRVWGNGKETRLDGGVRVREDTSAGRFGDLRCRHDCRSSDEGVVDGREEREKRRVFRTSEREIRMKHRKAESEGFAPHARLVSSRFRGYRCNEGKTIPRGAGHGFDSQAIE